MGAVVREKVWRAARCVCCSDGGTEKGKGLTSLDLSKLNSELEAKDKISEVQEALMNYATLMVAYPDAKEDQSSQWLEALNACRVELRRRFKQQPSQGFLR